MLAIFELGEFFGLATVESATVNAEAIPEPSPPDDSSPCGARGGLPRLRYLSAVVGFVPLSRAMLSSMELTLPLRLKSYKFVMGMLADKSWLIAPHAVLIQRVDEGVGCSIAQTSVAHRVSEEKDIGLAGRIAGLLAQPVFAVGERDHLATRCWRWRDWPK